jgi:hypothetical protein
MDTVIPITRSKSVTVNAAIIEHASRELGRLDRAINELWQQRNAIIDVAIDNGVFTKEQREEMHEIVLSAEILVARRNHCWNTANSEGWNETA